MADEGALPFIDFHFQRTMAVEVFIEVQVVIEKSGNYSSSFRSIGSKQGVSGVVCSVLSFFSTVNICRRSAMPTVYSFTRSFYAT